ncbi:MAG: cell division protein FtsQ/DivIB [Bacteroidales bacterium]|nr:cell division protein FtsQ/DivIB [Bacteroidales bacterium]
MRITPKHILAAASLALLTAVFGLLVGCGRSERAKVLCNALDVQIKDKYEFVTQEDIRSFLDRRYGPYIGVRLDSLDLGRMEQMLEEKSVVMESEAWTTRDGVLHISIVQRAPALRFQRGDQGFYIDDTGFVFPLHSSYTADVPLIEGNIPQLEDGQNSEWSKGILELMKYIHNSKQWKDQIENVSVDSAGDLEFKTTQGKERFIFGYPDDIQAKFGRLAKYYSHVRPSKDEGYYKSVNLKYNNQIICRKGI